ncbi:MAG: type I-A CRISPR-associated protein Cas5a [Candidatus Njordarchaeales archaeon]
MRVLELLASPIFFSIRLPEAYQVATSLLLPPPSAISGALAYSYAIWKDVKFQDSLEKFANSWCFTIPCAPIIQSSIILRRLRLLQAGESFARSKKEWERILKKIPSNVKSELEKRGLLDRSKLRYRHDFLRVLKDIRSDYYWRYYRETLFDAMIRGYVFTDSLYLGCLLSFEEEFMPCFTRLGDTESYLAIKELQFIDSFELKRISKGNEIESYSYVFLKYGGKALVKPMVDSLIQPLSAPGFLIERLKGRKRAKYQYVLPAILPLRREVRRIAGKDVEIFYPRKIRVKVLSEVYLLSYESKILKREVSIIIPEEAIPR